ncbi:MAG: nitroreductase family protein [Fimbriimonadaceae bacterium]|nr:nitroreductase family protein [Fimbriimonadaceae bacterium]QYK57558.1 MAG: nitroreductase family protein [Fimbriimonadaceae bacterium]
MANQEAQDAAAAGVSEEPGPLGEAWVARYGETPPVDVAEVDPFLTHRSVRDFSDRPVPRALVTALVAAAQSAATSSNLQTWSVVSVQDPVRRAEVARLCADQRQVRNAPWFFAFVADHHRLAHAASRVGEDALGLDYCEFYTMAVIDAALAAERMVCAAESLGLGICYIGALRNDAEGVKGLLNLPERVVGLFGLCLGWPDPNVANPIKPRLPQSSVWFEEEYDPLVGIGDYDDRMSRFYAEQGMKGDATWSMRSGRRVDEHHLTGREALLKFIQEQGFSRR